MILFCDIDAFYASVEEILNPELRGRPIVVGGSSGMKGVVASASYEARKYGVHSGMPIFQARRSCPDCLFIEGNFKFYEEYSKRFFKILYEFSPDVEQSSVDEAYLDIKGCERLYGSPLEMGRKIKRRILDETELRVTVGIGVSRAVAKMAADTVKPDGLIFIDRDDTERFLKSFPIDKAKGLGYKNKERLKNIGIQYVGDLLNLPDNLLVKILDRGGINWFLSLKSTGLVSGVRKSIGRETTLYQDTGDINFLLPILYYLVERSAGDLRRYGLKTTKVVVKVRFSDFKTITRGERIPPTNLSFDIFRVAAKILEGMVDRFVRLIGVRCEGLVRWSGLFHNRRENLESGIDEIRKRFGFNAILPGRVMEMKRVYRGDKDGFRLRTPSCSH